LDENFRPSSDFLGILGFLKKRKKPRFFKAMSNSPGLKTSVTGRKPGFYIPPSKTVTKIRKRGQNPQKRYTVGKATL